RGGDLCGMHDGRRTRYLPDEQHCADVVQGDFVSREDGSGRVHSAPAFGADDMDVGREHGLPILQTVDETGSFIAEVTPWAQMWVKDADPLITNELKERGRLHNRGR